MAVTKHYFIHPMIKTLPNILLIITTFILSVSIIMPALNSKKDYLGGRGNWKFILVLLIISGLLSFGFYYLSQLIIHKNKNANTEKYNKEFRISDSLREIRSQQIAVFKQKMQKDSLLKYIHSYYEAYCDNDKLKLKKFYKYPMVRYYTYTNASEETVQERRNFEGHPKSWGNTHCMFDDEKATITKVGKDSVEVSIQLNKVSDDVFYTTIELNKDWKIYSIMNTKRIIQDSTKTK